MCAAGSEDEEEERSGSAMVTVRASWLMVKVDGQGRRETVSGRMKPWGRGSEGERWKW